MFNQAASFINHTNRNVFLTGKAGTGKTTFLHFIKEHSAKKLAVVAPTGVAAINAGGTTIHSFLLLPWGTFLPSDTLLTDVSEFDGLVFTRPQLKAKLKFNRQRLALIRELELLIIDEVSMVRADMMDAIDFVLKTVRRNYAQPFGGVQMLFIGDMMQLPPVLKPNEEQLLKQYYESPYFFDAHVIKDANPLYIELKKIYRQSNEDFIDLLNKIRNNILDNAELQKLNSYYNPSFKPRREDEYITLTSHNYLADNINSTELENLDGKMYTFEAEISRDFPERMYPTEKTLQLKKGAQIMFVKNDKGEDRRFYNGKIGIVGDLFDDEIQIIFKNKEEPLLLKREKWLNVKYSYNSESDTVDEEELGSFSQFPIRLAWAITIHKSQGLTFDRAIIDAGASFASGQVYVALSRLSSLEGLVLRSKISPSSISTDTKVVDFSQQEREEEKDLPALLEKEQLAYIHAQVIKTFEWNRGYLMLKEYLDDKKSDLFDDEDDEVLEELNKSLKKLAGQVETADKFIMQLRRILPHKEGELCDYMQLHNRVSSAASWFSEALGNDIIPPLENFIAELKKQPRSKKKQKEVYDMLLFFERKKQQLEKTTEICRRLTQPFNISDVLGVINAPVVPAPVAETAKPAVKPVKGETRRISLRMFQAGQTIQDIAKERGLATTTIEGHLVSFIPTGETRVEDFVSSEKVQKIIDFYAQNPDCKTSSEAKEALGKDFSYLEIKAAQKYLVINPVPSAKG